ncbi:hypothetical protein SEA_FEDE_42 [Microbacterium phage Fede]|nr:hypothetical protein SEA_FEDE_42 [Microbacterium phage Fede]
MAKAAKKKSDETIGQRNTRLGLPTGTGSVLRDGYTPPPSPWNVLFNGNRTVTAPPKTNPGTLRNSQTSSSNDGGGGPGGGGGGGGISAAESNARRAGKEKSDKENSATQAIIDALLGSLTGYEKGRDQKIANADRSLQTSLQGIMESLRLATQDYDDTSKSNEEDQAAKSAANVTNRARERTSLLQQAASQGAGETDHLRAQIQAFLNSDANQGEVDRSFFDTQRSILSQVAGANSQAETSRRSSWNQNQEAIGSAWDEFWKNRGDVFTNIQRTAAANTNVDSDYSNAFNARYGGYDPVKEAAAAAGQTYKTQSKDDDYFKEGRIVGRDRKVTSGSRAGATQIKAPKAAEGATLRGRW